MCAVWFVRGTKLSVSPSGLHSVAFGEVNSVSKAQEPRDGVHHSHRPPKQKVLQMKWG